MCSFLNRLSRRKAQNLGGAIGRHHLQVFPCFSHLGDLKRLKIFEIKTRLLIILPKGLQFFHLLRQHNICFAQPQRLVILDDRQKHLFRVFFAQEFLHDALNFCQILFFQR